jgi:restriction system protein
MSAARGTSSTSDAHKRLDLTDLAVLTLQAAVVGTLAVLEAMEIARNPVRPWGYAIGLSIVLGGVTALLLRRRPAGEPAVKARARTDRARTDLAVRGALSRLDRMDPARLAEHVAGLCRRDGLLQVRTAPLATDSCAADITATGPGGHVLSLRCRSTAATTSVSCSVVARFVADTAPGALRVLAVTAGSFTAKARELAAAHGVVLLDRRGLARWDHGVDQLPALV